jgi:hypothetical protein
MKPLTAIGLASIVAYGILLVAKWDGSGTASEATLAAKASADARDPAFVSGSPASGANLVQAVPPRQLSTMRMPVSRPTALGVPASTVAAEFRSSRDLKAFADALAARKAQLTADERFHLAKALESCLFANSINEDLASYSAKQRRQFLASLPAGDPNAALRVAAFDNVDDTARCLRFRGTKIALRDIDDLYLAAAQQGDARAQAKLLVNEIQRTNQANPRDDAGNPSRIAPEDLARIVAILETGDPEALMTVGGLLAQSPIKEQLRIGPNEEMPEPTAFIGAWNLVACDMGLECGAQHRDLQQACAFAAYCGAGHFEEHYQTFVASPFVYQQAQRYRSLIHSALQTRNWAQLGLTLKLTTVAAKPSK